MTGPIGSAGRWRVPRPALVVAAVVAATLALVLLAWVTARSASPPPIQSANSQPAANQPAGAPASAAGPVPPKPEPSQSGGPTPAVAAVPTTNPPAAALPAPFIQPFGPPAPTGPPAVGASSPVAVAVNIDGCDHSYGDVNQCVPWHFPPGTTDGCAWLRAHGFGPLALHGPDRLGLDRDRDGIACGPGDG